MVVQVDQHLDGLLHWNHLYRRHFEVLLEELEPFDNSTIAGEEDLKIVLSTLILMKIFKWILEVFFQILL